MENSLQAARTEIITLNNIQKDINFVPSDEEKIYSVFDPVLFRTTFYVKSDILHEINSQTNNTFIFKIENIPFHTLLKTSLIFDLPEVSLKEEYQEDYELCYCTNIGTNLIKSGDFIVDNNHLGVRLNPIFFDVYIQHLCKKRGNFLRSIGNHLNIFRKNKLPAVKLSIRQPFYYTKDTVMAFPIIYTNKSNDISFKYEIRQQLANYVRLRRKLKADELHLTGVQYDNGYEYIDGSKVHEYLQEGNTIKPGIPSLINRYGYLPVQKEDDKKCQDIPDYFIQGNLLIPFDNFNFSATTASKRFTNPAANTAMFVLAENFLAKKFNNYSNYTDNVHHIEQGDYPIRQITLKYDESNIRLDNLPVEYFTLNCADDFPKSAIHNGYIPYSFARDIDNIVEADVSVCFKESTELKCVLEKAHEYKYQLYILMLNYQKLSISYDKRKELYKYVLTK